MKYLLISLLLNFLTTNIKAQNKEKGLLLISGVEEIEDKFKLKMFYGTASYYADNFGGRQTANGSSYSHKSLTAACNKLPLGTWIRVTNLKNKRSVVVEINDRLHPKNKRVVDLSKSAAEKLGYIKNGLTQVRVQVLGKKKP